MNKIKKLLNKYNAFSLPLKATLWFTICNFLQRGIGMITTPIFTRLMPTEEYGLFSTYISWESVLFMLVSLCLYKGIMNLYVKYEDKEYVLSSICGLEILISVFWLIVCLVFRHQISILSGLPVSLVICLFVSFVSQAGFQCWSLYKRYTYDYRILIVVTLLMTGGSAIVSTFSIVFVSPTATVRAEASTIVYALIGIFIYFLVFRKSKSFIDKYVWKFALGFCIPLMPHYLSEFILQSSDKIMINYMCGSHDVAIYSISYAIGSLIGLVTAAINSSFAPFQYQKIKSGEFDVLSKRANQILILIGLLLCLVMLFGKEIVLIFGGYKYEESIDTIIPICLGIYFNYMFQLFARVQEYYERKVTVVIPSILCAALNLLTNYIFILRYGYQAAAYTTFGCYLLFCFIHFLFYRKVCREILHGKQLFDTRILLLISCGVILGGCIIAIINQFILAKYCCIGIAVVVIIIKRQKIINAVRMTMSK
ncbi:lipopolysaccharide biosynthesis protein [uncultured Acetatifactor sp.]|jgi:O-antigen/teichoic acid export membrane protein|uniref:lipopolysaccharide biosynthesis protein n=1 Tax=uncultured Acetatifactor sp. TaxID=1671927 RepID=UPI00261C9A2B|nr:oligosaccharide flippase family protein [uncultured Acetatifactor sp.]